MLGPDSRRRAPRPTADNGAGGSPDGEILVPIERDADIVAARQRGRSLATDLGFSVSDRTLIATAISELSRNILQYAGRGNVMMRPLENGGHPGILVVARDEGPGIADVTQALAVGFSTSGGLGLGLPGVRRLVDSFEITTAPGQGTVVTAIKWNR